jgi:hypothetical protein
MPQIPIRQRSVENPLSGTTARSPECPSREREVAREKRAARPPTPVAAADARWGRFSTKRARNLDFRLALTPPAKPGSGRAPRRTSPAARSTDAAARRDAPGGSPRTPRRPAPTPVRCALSVDGALRATRTRRWRRSLQRPAPERRVGRLFPASRRKPGPPRRPRTETRRTPLPAPPKRSAGRKVRAETLSKTTRSPGTARREPGTGALARQPPFGAKSAHPVSRTPRATSPGRRPPAAPAAQRAKRCACTSTRPSMSWTSPASWGTTTGLASPVSSRRRSIAAASRSASARSSA